MESRVEGLIEMLHEVTDKSVAVGFGISAPDAVRACVELFVIASMHEQGELLLLRHITDAHILVVHVQ